MIYVMGNTFGSLFKISTWGESHGGGIGVVIDGCPSLLPLEKADIQRDLDRRRPGQSKITTQRDESDTAEILSGIFEGKTLGTPIAIMVRNEDAKPDAYNHLKDVYRPSHADFTYDAKYGIRNWQGGGRSSARETIGRVAAGAVARRLLNESTDMEVLAWVSQIHNIKANVQTETVNFDDIESEITRCPDRDASEVMTSAITEARKNGDSLGGIVTCLVRGAPTGLGVPVFDRIEADLAKAMLSLPASKGFDIGSGFSAVEMTGSEHNDAFEPGAATPVTTSNHSGGVQGGITNGSEIVFRVAFKPTATISTPQETVDNDNNPITLEAKGRHDPCVLPRAVPMVEAMTLLVMADHWLRNKSAQIPSK
jgi:chorismate synthase